MACCRENEISSISSSKRMGRKRDRREVVVNALQQRGAAKRQGATSKCFLGPFREESRNSRRVEATRRKTKS
eukprot:5666815-Pleurochrysis_carterae.AAC.2